MCFLSYFVKCFWSHTMQNWFHVIGISALRIDEKKNQQLWPVNLYLYWPLLTFEYTEIQSLQNKGSISSILTVNPLFFLFLFLFKRICQSNDVVTIMRQDWLLKYSILLNYTNVLYQEGLLFFLIVNKLCLNSWIWWLRYCDYRTQTQKHNK